MTLEEVYQQLKDQADSQDICRFIFQFDNQWYYAEKKQRKFWAGCEPIPVTELTLPT